MKTIMNHSTLIAWILLSATLSGGCSSFQSPSSEYVKPGQLSVDVSKLPDPNEDVKKNDDSTTIRNIVNQMGGGVREESPERLLMQANSYFEQKRYHDSARLYKKYLNTPAGAETQPELLGTIHYRIGYVANKKTFYKEAQAEYALALQYAPLNNEYLFAYAKACYDAGDFAIADQQFVALLSRAPGYPEAEHYYGLTLLESVNRANALQPLTNALGALQANELLADKYYAVGDLAKIQIASNRADAVVFVKIRTENDGLGEGKPIMLQLKNGVAELPVKILNRDQPNFFVEASTVFEGRFYDETKEIAVPPAERTLDIAVEPSKERVKPGEKAKIKLRLTDPNGDPVVGQTVATIYDKSLDDLVGGVANQDIREFFWKWRRYCNGSTFSSNASAGTLFDAWGYVTIGKKWTPLERGMQRLATIGLFNESMNNVVFSKARTLDAVGGMGGKGTVLSRASIPVSGLNRAMALADDADMEMAVAEESAADMDMGGGMRMEAKASGPAWSTSTGIS